MKKIALTLLLLNSFLAASAYAAPTNSKQSNGQPQFIQKIELKSNELIVYTGKQAKKVIKLSKEEAEHIGHAGHLNLQALEKKLSEYKLQWPVAKKK